MSTGTCAGAGSGIRIAVCQTLCLPDDLEGNCHRMRCAIQAAANAGAQLACFPETAFLGWVNPNAHHRAHPVPGAWSDMLCALAREHEMMVCAGLAERDGAALYDAAVLVSTQGDLLLKHRKINTLVHLLSPPYGRGKPDEIAVAETELGRIAMLICADTFLGELLERVAALAPDLLLVPYGWAAEPHKWPQHGQNLARVAGHAARIVGCTVVGTDCVGIIGHGPWTGYTFGGQSVVADATGQVLAVAKDREPDVLIVDL